MITISVSDEIKTHCPHFAGIAIYAVVENSAYNEHLWKAINQFAEQYRLTYRIEDVKNNPAIAATRAAYKKMGKDPNRYRTSADALCRRIVKDIPLYQIDTLVDLINLASIRTGYSIGGFDAGKIEGNELILGIGKANEPYEAIGRGMLNIEGLPVYRDTVGGIGTPTSDHERTKISIGTTRLLTIINGYSGKVGLTDAAEYMQILLTEYANSSNVEMIYF